MDAGEHGGATPDAVAALLRGRAEHAPIELPVSGASMAGDIASGSTAIVDRAARPRVGEIWAFVADDGGIVVHRIREHDGHTVTGRGTGNRYDDEPVPVSRLVGRVVAARDADGHTRRFGPLDRRRAAASLHMRRLARRHLPDALRGRLDGSAT
jgi:hypothetical protein